LPSDILRGAETKGRPGKEYFSGIPPAQDGGISASADSFNLRFILAAVYAYMKESYLAEA